MQDSNLRGRSPVDFESTALTTRPTCRCSWAKGWRIRVSIPVPRACKARTLPIELIPHGRWTKRGRARPPPGTPGAYRAPKSDPGRTRTCNRLIRSQARYPLRHRAIGGMDKTGSSGIRTHASRWRLELESSALDRSAMKPWECCKMATPVGFEPTRAEPTHLAGERLNHSAKASHWMTSKRVAKGGFDPPTFGL